jgi:hypothetical protein
MGGVHTKPIKSFTNTESVSGRGLKTVSPTKPVADDDVMVFRASGFTSSTEGFLKHVLKPREKQTTFVRTTSRECLGMGKYALQWLKTKPKNKVVFVAKGTKGTGRNALAFCTMRPARKTLFIDFICVYGQKGKGVGKKLFDSIREFARGHRYKYIELTSLQHPKTIEFYKRMGFTRGPGNATSGTVAKARAVYKNMKKLQETATSTGINNGKSKKALKPNAVMNDLSFFNNLIFTNDTNEVRSKLPKFHRAV